MKKALFIFGAVLMCLASCRRDYLYEMNFEIPDKKWAYQDTLNFDFDISDTTEIYNLWLCVGHAENYKFQNLYINIYTRFPTGERIKELLSLELADKTGRWFGDCGGVCELKIPIQKGAFFKLPGNYTITIEQYMRQNPLEGIHNLSLKIEDTRNKRQ